MIVREYNGFVTLEEHFPHPRLLGIGYNTIDNVLEEWEHKVIKLDYALYSTEEQSLIGGGETHRIVGKVRRDYEVIQVEQWDDILQEKITRAYCIGNFNFWGELENHIGKYITIVISGDIPGAQVSSVPIGRGATWM
jgi:hypothetical protein